MTASREIITADYSRLESVKDLKKTAFKDHPLQVLLLEQALVQLGYQVRLGLAEVMRAMANALQQGRTISPDLRQAMEHYADAEKNEETITEFVSALPLSEIQEHLEATEGERLFHRFTQRANAYRRVAFQKTEVLDRLKENPAVLQEAKRWARASTTHEVLSSAT